MDKFDAPHYIPFLSIDVAIMLMGWQIHIQSLVDPSRSH